MKTIIILFSMLIGITLHPLDLAAQCPNYALQFDGTTSGVHIGQFNGGPEVTIEAWINCMGSNGDFQAIVSSTIQWAFMHFQLFPPNTGGNIAIYTNAGEPLLPTIDPQPYNQWRHVAVTCKSGDIRLYVDSVLIGTSSATYSSVLPGDLYIGSGYAAGPGRHFIGIIDEVRIWDVARTAQQIFDNQNIHLTGNESGLEAYYPFDEGSGNSTADVAGNGHTGTIINGTTWVASTAPLTPCCQITSITSPEDQEVLIGGTAVFHSDATGTPTPTIQWQVSTDAGTTWVDCAGETGTTLTVSDITMSQNGNRYRTAFTNTCGTTFSDEAVLIVKIIVTDLGPVQLCIGSPTNSNNGKKMNLLVELFRNDEKILEGKVLNQQIVGNAQNTLSKVYTIALPQLPSGITFAGDDILQCRVSVQREGGASDFPVNLWFNGSPTPVSDQGNKAWSRIQKVTVNGSSSDFYYLRSDMSLQPASGSSAEYVTQNATINTFQELGEWAILGSSLKKGGAQSASNLTTILDAEMIGIGTATDPQLRLNTDEPGVICLSLYDELGNTIRNYSSIYTSGQNQQLIPIDLAGVSSGVYTLIVRNGRQTKALRFPVIR